MIFWIFGGTAVGKKRFISQALDPLTRPPFLVLTEAPLAVWINDGALTENLQDLEKTADLLVRWQWGREEILIDMLHKQVGQHGIIVLTAAWVTQMSRIVEREGCLKWDAAVLFSDQQSLYERVFSIWTRFRMPIWFVDASQADYYSLRCHIA